MRRALFAAAAAALLFVPGAAAWTWPVDGPVLRPFVLGDDPYAGGQHRGVDIGGEVGESVRAPASGTVSFAGTVPGGGRTITIRTEDGYSVTLLQLGSVLVARGAVVDEGTGVATVGESGDPETPQPHVHLGIRRSDDPHGYVDPLSLLPSRAPAPLPLPVTESPVAAPSPAGSPPPEPPAVVAPPVGAPAVPPPAAPPPSAAPVATPAPAPVAEPAAPPVGAGGVTAGGTSGAAGAGAVTGATGATGATGVTGAGSAALGAGAGRSRGGSSVSGST